MTYPPKPANSATSYHAGRLSPGDTCQLAGEILAIHGREDDWELLLYLTRQLRALPMPGGSAREILDAIGDALALLVVFAEHENPGEAQLAMQVLLFVAFSKRGPGEADELAQFDFEASPWWRNFIAGLQAFGAEWAAEEGGQPP